MTADLFAEQKPSGRFFEIPPLRKTRVTEAIIERDTAALRDIYTLQHAELTYVTTERGLSEVITYCSAHPYIALDIETAAHADYVDWIAGPPKKKDRQAAFNPQTSWIRLYQLCPDGRNVYVIDAGRIEESIVKLHIQRLLDAPVQLVAHNAVFEMTHLLYHGFTLHRPLSCTRLSGRAQGHIKNLSLAGRTKTEFGIDLVKGELTGGSNWAVEKLSKLQIYYAGIDALECFKLFERDRARIQTLNAGGEYMLYHNAQLATVHAKLNGFPIDRARLDNYIEARASELEAATRSLKFVMPGVNIRSAQQLGAWLTANLPAEVIARWPRTGGGALSTDDKALGKFKDLRGVRELLAAKKAQTLLQAAEGWREFINPVTGRIHANLQIAQAATGRFACSSPNQQNISSEGDARAIFAAKPGYKLIGADYSQIELRLIAVLAPIPLFLKTYETGGDVYIDVAKEVLGISEEQWAAKSDDDKKRTRKIGKIMALSLNYRAGPSVFRKNAEQQGVVYTHDEAQHMVDAYLDKTAMRQWHATITQMAKLSMEMVSAAGRKRRFAVEGQKAKDLHTTPANTRIQASGADLILECWKTIDARLTRELPRAELILTVHDEVIVHAPEADAPAVAVILKEEMEQAVRTILGSLADPIMRDIVEPAIGDTWSDIH